MGHAPAPFRDDQSIVALQQNIRGRLVRPGDELYESARRVYNGDIDCRPLAILQCADVADVIHAVNFAREQRLVPAIRGGGHSVPGFGTCDGGIVIDLARLKGIRVDPERRTVRVEGGCTWGDVDHATHVFGLAAVGGLISSTGVGGLTTGGGFGYLTRQYGLVCDNLLSADVVTAGGQLLRASESENPDLFWAIRGGSGNFGVVTSFEFRLHPVAMMNAGPLLFPVSRGPETLRLFGSFMKTAPRELSAFFAYLKVPPGPHFPEELHMKTMCGIVAAHSGDKASAEAAIRPLMDAGPAFGFNVPMPYPVLQSLFDPLLPPGMHQYWKADFTGEITPAIISAHAVHGPRISNIHSAMHIYPMDGAVHDVASDATAFAYRDVQFTHVIAGITPDPADLPAQREWARDYYAALHPHSAGGAYVNFLMEEGDERVAASFRGNYRRLAEVKARYDPGNLFRRNQNIAPAA
jgi:hypothetical protein